MSSQMSLQMFARCSVPPLADSVKSLSEQNRSRASLQEFARLAFFTMARKLWSSCAEELSAIAAAFHAATAAQSATTHATADAKP